MTLDREENGAEAAELAVGPAALGLLAGFGLFTVGLVAAAWGFRAELEALGRWFVASFGVAGMAIGALLADGVHFPVPPQFYLLAGIAGGHTRAIVFGSVAAGSIAGGLVAFSIGRLGSETRLFRRAGRGPRRLVDALVRRWGYRGLAVTALLPLSYWLLASTAGVLSLPYRAYAVIALARVPRLFLSYALIVAAWQGGSP